MDVTLKLLKRFFIFCVVIFVFIFLIALMRTILIAKPISGNTCHAKEEYFFADNHALTRLSEALKFKTITSDRQIYDRNELDLFLKFLTMSFPTVHSSPLIKREIVNNYSLLYSISGSDPSLMPYLLAGHMDVVPVDEKAWEFSPFSGKIKDGYINGRGAIDAKDIVFGILEALEFLLKKDYIPCRSFFLAFGHDEEGGGVDGANHISQVLSSRGVNLEFLLDEGIFVLNNTVPGVSVPVAMVGVSEKGSLTVELKVISTPGHSSIPPKETAIVILSKALSKLQGDVFPSMLGKGSEEEYFQTLAPYATFLYRLVYSNIWLFNPILSWKMTTDNVLSALIRTTTAVTMVSGGLKDNVVPSSASATVNFRVHPAQTINEVVEYVKYLINDNRVHISIKSSFPPHPISPYSNANFGYAVIKQSIQQIYPDCSVVPVIVVANTDTRWYLNLTKSVYRFSPVNLKLSEISRFHGHNEKIAVHNYLQLINFYIHLIRNSDKLIKLERDYKDEF